MKIAPIIRAINNAKTAGKIIDFRLVHTGQHYDKSMSGSFFEQLNIPEPHANLNCGGGTHAEQTAAIMIAFEKELLANPCDWVIVVGDVNSTLACSITAKKLQIKVAHVEGGIRSGDWSMPEEINRLVTDSGGITEETTVMGVPCITMRNSTERPETVNIGTNELIGTEPVALQQSLAQLVSGAWKQGGIPEKWDGRAAERIVKWFG
jgi:UDP-N-acetylglucosamine 2-epimerase (non-hydrolysing)